MIAIIDYNAGNIQSVRFALNRLGIEPVLTNDTEQLLKAEKVIFPGVGEAGTAMKFLKEKNLDKLIPQLSQPVLGICLGLQLMCQHSEESNTDCLRIFPVKVKKFNPVLKVPHVGWNSISKLKSPLFRDCSENSFVYYVHSYYAEAGEHTIAETNYINPFSAALQKNNFYAVQFHPEKSSSVGEQILKNFLTLQ
jgi:glutamine amidotransferase